MRAERHMFLCFIKYIIDDNIILDNAIDDIANISRKNNAILNIIAVSCINYYRH